MAVLLNLLFLLAVGTLGFAVIAAVVLPTVHLVIRKRPHYRRRLLASVALLLVAYVVSVGAWYKWATRPSAVFEMAFRFPPSPDVRIDQSSHFVLGDQGSQTLRFSAGLPTIARIAREQFGVDLDEQTIDDAGSYHLVREFSEHFASEKIVLRYNPARQFASYSWVGVD